MDEYRPAETFDQSKRSKNTFVNDLLTKDATRFRTGSWVTAREASSEKKASPVMQPPKDGSRSTPGQAASFLR